MAWKADVAVTVVDDDPSKIKFWNSGKVPINEPGLDLILEETRVHDGCKRTRTENLVFSTDFQEVIGQADFVFICVGTAVQHQNAMEPLRTNLDDLWKVVSQIARCSRGKTIVVEKSTVPCQDNRHDSRDGKHHVNHEILY